LEPGRQLHDALDLGVMLGQDGAEGHPQLPHVLVQLLIQGALALHGGQPGRAERLDI